MRFTPIQVQLQQHSLPLVQLDEWDEDHPYNENLPSCIHSSIEWKVTLNSRGVSRDTEQDLVLNSSSHRDLFLRPKSDQLLSKEYLRRRVEIDDTGTNSALRSEGLPQSTRGGGHVTQRLLRN